MSPEEAAKDIVDRLGFHFLVCVKVDIEEALKDWAADSRQGRPSDHLYLNLTRNQLADAINATAKEPESR